MNNRDFICENLSSTEDGELLFAGQSTKALAKQYGTPLYLMDEDRIRDRVDTYRTAMRNAFGDKGQVLYASKAASFKRLYEIMREEGVGIDVVSSGEIRTAIAAGYPLERAYFHSNNKTDADIAYAMDNGIGYFVVDNDEELYAIEAEAKRRKIRQKILLRLTPGIDPHTYAAIATGMVDSKFGSAIETGQAYEITELAISLPHICLCGFHCHVGSQVFDSSVYLQAAEVMLTFVADMKRELGFVTEQLDLGGGYGVRYVADQPEIDIAANIAEVAAYIKNKVAELGIEMPKISMEPGRSIVADAGLTLYTVGTVKRIPGYKNYVSVDGGMTDNPRFALYGSSYTVLLANRANDQSDAFRCSVVGRCCESGDILQENVELPDNVGRGEILAVLTTGAYNYSMSSNYNRIPKPPVVMLSGGTHRIAVRRESFEDICRNDL